MDDEHMQNDARPSQTLSDVPNESDEAASPQPVESIVFKFDDGTATNSLNLGSLPCDDEDNIKLGSTMTEHKDEKTTLSETGNYGTFSTKSISDSNDNPNDNSNGNTAVKTPTVTVGSYTNDAPSCAMLAMQECWTPRTPRTPVTKLSALQKKRLEQQRSPKHIKAKTVTYYRPNKSSMSKSTCTKSAKQRNQKRKSRKPMSPYKSFRDDTNKQSTGWISDQEDESKEKIFSYSGQHRHYVSRKNSCTQTDMEGCVFFENDFEWDESYIPFVKYDSNVPSSIDENVNWNEVDDRPMHFRPGSKFGHGQASDNDDTTVAPSIDPTSAAHGYGIDDPLNRIDFTKSLLWEILGQGDDGLNYNDSKNENRNDDQHIRYRSRIYNEWEPKYVDQYGTNYINYLIKHKDRQERRQAKWSLFVIFLLLVIIVCKNFIENKAMDYHTRHDNNNVAQLTCYDFYDWLVIEYLSNIVAIIPSLVLSMKLWKYSIKKHNNLVYHNRQIRESQSSCETELLPFAKDDRFTSTKSVIDHDEKEDQSSNKVSAMKPLTPWGTTQPSHCCN